MASGDYVVQIEEVLPPDANYARQDERIGGSTPSEIITVLEFDDATITYVDLKCKLSADYGGGGLTFENLGMMAETVTSGVMRMGMAIRAIPDDAEDLDIAHTYDFNEVDITAPSISGEVTYDDVTFTDGADMDNLAAGEDFILRIRRNATHANDTMTDTAQLASLPLGKET